MSGYHEIAARDPIAVEEVVVGVERVGQPTPDLNPKGWGCCFACSSAAIIRYFAAKVGQRAPTLEEVYAVWAGEEVKAPTGGDFWAFEKFWNAWRYGGHHPLELETEQDPPVSLPDDRYSMAHAFGPFIFDSNTLWKRIRTRIDAGWLVHVEVQHEPQRTRAANGQGALGADHLVVIDGYRETVRHEHSCMGEGYDASWHGMHEKWLHVVDSARKFPEPYWIRLQEWKDNHGGFNMWFVRPARQCHVPLPQAEPCPLGHKAAKP